MKTILDKAHTWFMSSVSYTDEDLIITVVGGLQAEHPEEIDLGGGQSLGQGYRVSQTEKSMHVQLTFPTVAAYQVIDESFTSLDEYDAGDGGSLQIMERSRFKDMIENHHSLLPTLREACRYYRLWTEDAVVDVVTDEEPIIEDAGSSREA